jgi:hypothetical protein
MDNPILEQTQGQVYDPTIRDSKSTNIALWTSESVVLADKGIKSGYRLRESPYYANSKDIKLRKGGLSFNYSPEEIEILKLVWNDKILWANNFPSLKDGDNGWRKITLRDYQEKLLKRYIDNRFNIIMFPRQSGKTTTTILEIVHFAMANTDKDIVCVAQSDTAIGEILIKIKECFGSMPFFMQPGVISWTSEGFTLDNGVRLKIGMPSVSLLNGMSLDFFYLDEFGYYKDKVAETFWINAYPTLINNPKSRCIITSTPNGRNLFWTLWYKATQKLNKFIHYKIHWMDVPRSGYKDHEEFKQETISNIGEIGWELGFECSFDTSLKSIFSTSKQKQLREKQELFENKNTSDDAKNNLWSKNNNPYGNIFDFEFINTNETKHIQKGIEVINEGETVDFENDYFIAGIDLSEGLNQDSSVIKLRKLKWCTIDKKIKYVPVAIYWKSDISVEEFAKNSMEFFMLFNPSKLRVVVEVNTYGAEYFLQVKHIRMTQPKYGKFDNIIFAKFENFEGNNENSMDKIKFHVGVRWDRGNKPIAVRGLLDYVNTNVFVDSHFQTLEEYLSFGKNDNGTYSSQYGHDDLVMVDVSMAYWLKTNSIYCVSYLSTAEDYLRELSMDLSQEKLTELLKIVDEKKAIHEQDGYTITNHEKNVEIKKNRRGGGIYI